MRCLTLLGALVDHLTANMKNILKVMMLIVMQLETFLVLKMNKAAGEWNDEWYDKLEEWYDKELVFFQEETKELKEEYIDN